MPRRSRTNVHLLQRYPVLSYFALTYTVSWGVAFLVVAPRLSRGEPISKVDGLVMFPVMLLGPSLSGIFLTRVVDGKSELRDLFSQMRRVRLPVQWYAALLIPPALILIVLLGLKTFVSPAFAPNLFLIGVLFGVPAGFLEEIGWTGFAFPRMRKRLGPLAASVLLGLLWGVWHLPVIDYLGTATPHGAYWFRYFLAFPAAMTAIRVLIGWLYSNTKSVLFDCCGRIEELPSASVSSPR